ncbi:hypothetical protein KIH77_08655 [Bifidobacterium sp. 82T24]|uniref:hypothetical protein n=1 Tax=Bifidobacterium pluvialisilvae TaxID=2834436 RepID=UPI001C5714A3|nr:hypothetical protein [Bifidobacterium pluvialisilvae]MBW3088792.1 hypothetical protein [Bifidobacterium pluvialisilvae]
MEEEKQPEYGQMAPATPPAQEETKQPGRNRLIITIAAAAAAGLIIGGAIGGFVGHSTGYTAGQAAEVAAQKQAAKDTHKKKVAAYENLTNKLSSTYDECYPSGIKSDYLIYYEGTLELSTTKYSAGTTLNCIEEKLDMPSALVSQIGQTNAYNGVQSKDFDGYTTTWSFNWNKGLSFSVTPTEPKPE